MKGRYMSFSFFLTYLRFKNVLFIPYFKVYNLEVDFSKKNIFLKFPRTEVVIVQKKSITIDLNNIMYELYHEWQLMLSLIEHFAEAS